MAYLDENFLLSNDAARRLYFDYAQKQPILDFHCHLPVKDIARDRKFSTITEAWLSGDHYKWRSMRTFGVPESEITGDTDDRAKFLAWARVLPLAVRNPIYHWSHLELKRYFGVESLLSETNADEIFETTSHRLSTDPAMTARGMIERMSVRYLCTTDDPADTLEEHLVIAQNPINSCVVLPAFRPDRALVIDGVERFLSWLRRLEDTAGGSSISTVDRLLAVLGERHELFHAHGCRLADYGLEHMYAGPLDAAAAERAFGDLLEGNEPSPGDLLSYRSVVLYELARMHSRHGWTQQYHLGSLRDNNTARIAEVGQATGYDSIGDFEQAKPLVRFLDRLEQQNQLAKTILFVLNPRDNEMIASIIGSFQKENVRGKMQFGSAWWFNDSKLGMRAQINALSTIGFVASSVGMLTDSRSFLSFPRHEYFRRVLCSVFGEDIEAGDLPGDYSHIGGIIADISYDNALRYFSFPEVAPASEGMEAHAR